MPLTHMNVRDLRSPEGAVNAISLSMHDPGRAHLAIYRYRQNDRRPYLYQTNDYGKTWKRIADGTNGIDAGGSGGFGCAPSCPGSEQASAAAWRRESSCPWFTTACRGLPLR